MSFEKCRERISDAWPLVRNCYVVIGLLSVGLVFPRILSAGGTQTSLHGDDLQIEVDTRWCGCRFGGYYPIRIEIKNDGKGREVTVRFSNRDVKDLHSSVTERRIRVEEGATRKFTLSVPLNDESVGGPLQVLVDGTLAPQLVTNVALPAASEADEHSPEMLVIAASSPDLTVFRTVVWNARLQPGGGLTGLKGRTGSDSQAEVIEPGSLPDAWVDYSGVDLIAVSLKTWQSNEFSEAAREAILKWVTTGGTLIIHEVGGPARESQELSKLLQLPNRAAVSSDWIPGNFDVYTDKIEVGAIVRDELSHSVKLTRSSQGRTPDAFREEPWSHQIDAAAFERRELMLGRVYALPGHLFPGSLEDWSWLLADIGSHNTDWKARHGFHHRRPSQQFGEFKIPQVGEVPARMFLVLITVFTLVIGPVNYFVLNRRRQLYLLLVTIPVFAVLTSVSLFGYAILADGLDVKSRLRSVTLLDQRNHEAVSVTRAGYYAGLSPWGGLKFSPETLVLPVWPRHEAPVPSDVDWTDGQHFASNWLRSRTPTQFMFSSNRIERGRLEVSAISGNPNELQVANGFSWDIDEIMLRDQSDTVFYGQNLRAGSVTILKWASSDELAAFGDKIGDSLVVENSSAPSAWNRTREKSHRRGRHASMLAALGIDEEPPTDYSKSQGELALKNLRDGFLGVANVPDLPPISPHSYVAICNQPPALDLGLAKITEISSIHVLFGRY